MKQTEPSKILTITQRCLWGLDPQQINLTDEQDRNKIIARSFDMGTHQDKLNVLAYFGRETVQQALIKSPELNLSTISLTALWLDIDPTLYAAYKRPRVPDSDYVSF